jgi:mevalonate kinase
LSGEYFVLDGATALAVPTRFGQTLTIKIINQAQSGIEWQSFSHDGECWFDAFFELENLKATRCSDQGIADTLSTILLSAKNNGQHFFDTSKAYHVSTNLDFPRLWGLGSSSTLIHALANFAKANPYLMLHETMGGSGYDIACADANNALLFQRKGFEPIIKHFDFQPIFKHHLYFVYLGKKQNSREGIQRYQERSIYASMIMNEINDLTAAMCNAQTLSEFEEVINAHETLVSETLELPKAKDLYFSDYWGTVKSLGAWGGDFVMVSSARDMDATKRYFKDKGFDTFLPYGEMVL